MQSATIIAAGSIESDVPVIKTLLHSGYAAIRSFSFTAFKKGSVFTEDNTVIFIREGTLKFRYGKAAYEAAKNQIIFIKKDVLVQYETGAQPGETATTAYIMFFLKFELVRAFTKLVELCIPVKEELPAVVLGSPDTQLLKYMDMLEQYFCTPEKTASNLVRIKLLELLFYLSSSNLLILEQLLDCRAHYRTNITATVEDNIMNALSLYQLAVLSGRSLSSFKRDFLAIYNMPPSQWIRQKRLEKAKELLTGSTMSVTDICYTTGFENIAHFSRLFKSRFGISPSEYRFARSIA